MGLESTHGHTAFTENLNKKLLLVFGAFDDKKTYHQKDVANVKGNVKTNPQVFQHKPK